MRTVAPQLPGTIETTSEGTPWAGFPLELHRLPSCGESPPYVYPHSTVFLYREGETDAEISWGRSERAQQVRRVPGTANIRRRGWTATRFRWSGQSEIELLAVQLCPHTVEGLGAAQVVDGLDDVFEEGVTDRQLAALMIAMQLEVERGCPSGALYGESLSLSLAAYAASRYGARPAAAEPERNKLTAVQLARVSEYVRDNIGENLRLSDLAAVVSLSTHRFLGLFRNTVGVTPHQFVIGERIRMACALLREGRESIAEIALKLGFSSHSHFCDTFRKHTGRTPSGLR